MAQTIVTIICNFIAVLILVCGILKSINCGWKVSLTKFILVCGGAVGTYILAPWLTNKLLNIQVAEVSLGKVLETYHISHATVGSCLFLLIFLLFYCLASIICSILKHCLIKGMKKRAAINRAKIQRAKSINAEAEKAAKKTAWKEMKLAYKQTNNVGKRIISIFFGIILSTLAGFVVIMPFGYVAKDLNYKGTKEYLVKGYEKTLPGLLGEKRTDWVIRYDREKEEIIEEPEKEEELPDVVIPEEGDAQE